jgi:hypothetical protein
MFSRPFAAWAIALIYGILICKPMLTQVIEGLSNLGTREIGALFE